MKIFKFIQVLYETEMAVWEGAKKKITIICRQLVPQQQISSVWKTDAQQTDKTIKHTKGIF